MGFPNPGSAGAPVGPPISAAPLPPAAVEASSVTAPVASQPQAVQQQPQNSQDHPTPPVRTPLYCYCKIDPSPQCSIEPN